jgi:hypothetical protein
VARDFDDETHDVRRSVHLDQYHACTGATEAIPQCFGEQLWQSRRDELKMQINLRFVSQTFDVIEGEAVLWRVIPTDDPVPTPDLTSMRAYPFHSVTVAIESVDGHAIHAHVTFKLRRRSDGSLLRAFMVLTKDFTDRELLAGAAEINLDTYKAMLLRVVDEKGPFDYATIKISFPKVKPTIGVTTDQRGELTLLALPGEYTASAGDLTRTTITVGADLAPRFVVVTRTP